MSTRSIVVAIVLATGCSQESLSNKSEGDALILHVDAKGTPTLNGREMNSVDLLGLKRPETDVDLDPVILRVQSGSTMGSLTSLLSTLIVKARKSNIAFLIETPTERLFVHLPVLRALPYLHVTTGGHVYHEGRLSPDDQRHLWLGARVGESGSCRIESLDRRRFDEVDFSEAPQSPTWKGDHPAFGVWSENQLSRFLSEPRIQDLSPFLDLEVRPEDSIIDFLECLQVLHRVAPGRVLVSIPSQ
jgi:hypothetical protein